VHNGLARLLAKSRLKVLAIMQRQKISRHGLSSVLVYPLEDLVSGRIAQSRKEGHELARNGSASLVLENDLVELARIGDLGRVSVASSKYEEDKEYWVVYLALVAHQSLRNRVDL
jgi:hypothetical protein